MNLCSNHDILLWDIKNQGEYYTMCITVSGFRKLKGIVKKTGTKVAIQERCGLPFFIPRMKKRKIFLIGLLGSLVFWMWMSTFIWAVDISGNYSISEDIFMDFLRNHNVYVGMKRSKVDIEELEKKIRQDFEIVTWTSARIDGTRLVIQVRENEVDTGGEKMGDAAEQEEIKTAKSEFGSDLVAEEDGVIVNMVTRQGVPQVSVGMEVKKGDILVSGSVPVYNEDATVKFYQYYDADADVYIRRQLRKKEELPLHYEKKEYTGEEKREMLLSIMDKDLVFRMGKIKYENYDKITDKKQVKLLENFYLPFYYGKSVNREYIVMDNIYTEKEVKAIFSEKLIKYIESLEEKGVQIIKKNVTINKNQKKWQMNMDFQVIEKTGKNVAIAVKEEIENGGMEEEASVHGTEDHAAIE